MNGKKLAIGAAIFAAWITVVEVVGRIRRKQGFDVGYNSELSADDINRFYEIEREERERQKTEG